jgi:hypothetical protein
MATVRVLKHHQVSRSNETTESRNGGVVNSFSKIDCCKALLAGPNIIAYAMIKSLFR